MAEPARVTPIRDCCRATAQAYEKRLVEVGQALHNAERDLRGKRAQITRLEAELAKALAEDPLQTRAEEVWEFWRQEIHPKAREFGPKRQKAVIGRLRAYAKDDALDEGVETLKLAILGAKADAYVDAKGVRHDDLELICRDATNVDLNLKRYHASQATPAPTPQPLPRGAQDALLMAQRGFYRESLPVKVVPGLDLYLARCDWCERATAGTTRELAREGWWPTTGGAWSCPEHASVGPVEWEPVGPVKILEEMR